MKTETANLPRSITNNLRITSMAIVLIGVYLLIPKTGTTTTSLTDVSVNSFSNISESFTIPEANAQELQPPYIPPNYGGPDSQHGSGTR
ncbi:hypothetical protein H6G41_13785 [Tolypothrix sp. FACHB-123]|uniref:hypothetical protein n=1 Tax=Tolypothrix sp. FACHB-123 TaxID=2692868 RepID=UPI001689ED47|nr:hypothetical protein [Tolypothrix sp. FACHB-123]MBD2355675.1 hypothetical protein [Tolypothrix sp. FACHB-123]